jgi:hypothetical protein
MTTNQEYYLGLYVDNANQAYSLMHDARVDYDTYKPIADSSLLKTEQAKKMLEKLFVIYINYPAFINGLRNIYNTAKEQSDLENFYLTEKLNKLNSLKSKYDSWIDKINALQIQIDEDILSKSIQDIADDPRSLEKSDELVLIKKKADDEAARIAAEKAAEAARIAAENAKNAPESANAPEVIKGEINKDIITGSEACVDKNGNLIDMSICRPSVGGGGGGGGGTQSASQIVDKNVSYWLDNIIKQVTPKVAPPPPIIAPPAPIEPAKEEVKKEENPIETPKEEVKEETIKEAPKEVEAPKEETKDKAPATEDIINSFIFNVDLSKLISDRKGLESDKDLGLGLGSGGPAPQDPNSEDGYSDLDLGLGSGGLAPQEEVPFEIIDPLGLGLGLGSGGPNPMGGGFDTFDPFDPMLGLGSGVSELPTPVPTPIVKEEIKKSNSVPIQPIRPIVVADVNQPILKTVDIKSMTPIYLGAGLVSALIVYNIWKKKS